MAVYLEDFIDALSRAYAQIDRKLCRQGRWFRNLWESNSSIGEFYELAKKIDPEITLSVFDKGWQYRLVLHENYKQARIEFINILLEWY